MTNSGARKTAIKATTLKGLILNLRKILGYEACGLLSIKGKLLARDVTGQTVDVELLADTLNNLLLQSKAAAANAGMESCSQFSIKTPSGRQVMIRCSGENSPLHFHFIVSLGDESDVPRVGLEIDSFLDQVFAEFSDN